MSDPAPTSAYARFLCTFFESPRRDGPDLHVLDELSSDERDRAEQQLLDHLPESLDAMRGLAYLRSMRAVEPLRELMRHSRSVGVYAAIALWDITMDQEALRFIYRTVEDRRRWRRRYGRVDAAAMLTHIDRREAIAALITALDDRDVAVSANAWSVAERLQLNAEADAVGSGYMTLREFRALAWAALDERYPQRPGHGSPSE